ncbi:transcriptional regulator family: Fungal Specific TF [Aspergillus niger]|nr:transcriptional regulator family: Fungal Specific TF [Aspergillus niger]
MLSFQHQVIVGCSSCGKASGRTRQVNVRPPKFLADHMTQTETQLYHQSHPSVSASVAPVISVGVESPNATVTSQSALFAARRAGPAQVALGLFLERFPRDEDALRRFLRDPQCKKQLPASDLAERGRQSRLAKYVYRVLNRDSQDESSSELEDDTGLAPRGCDVGNHGEEEGERTAQARSAPGERISQVVSVEYLNQPIPDNTNQLLQFYFTHIHSWFPIIERRDVLRVMHTPPDASWSARDAACRLVLWAIVAYSLATDDTLGRGSQVDPTQVAQSIRLQVLRDIDRLQLGHLQSLLIITLLYLGVGHLRLAWVLVGEATRMLEMLPESARCARYLHIRHGCILIDNLTSAILEKAPCASLDDLRQCALVSEDDVDEWELWSMLRPDQASGGSVVAKGPLRALSTLNLIHEVMRFLTRILYYPSGTLPIQELVVELRNLQALVAARRPYRGLEFASPPLLTLHLTTAFVVFSLALKHKTFDPAIKPLAMTSLRLTLEILDAYTEITGMAGSSPLLRCFSFQAYRCLQSAPSMSGPGMEQLSSRLIHHMQQLKRSGEGGTSYEALRFTWLPLGNHLDWSYLPVPRLTTQRPLVPEGTVYGGPDLNMGNMPISDQVMAMPGLSSTSGGVMDVGNERQAQETEDFDALFEEMVASIPQTRNEPTFAENLGFYAGNLDTDFLAQLQHVPDNS